MVLMYHATGILFRMLCSVIFPAAFAMFHLESGAQLLGDELRYFSGHSHWTHIVYASKGQVPAMEVTLLLWLTVSIKKCHLLSTTGSDKLKVHFLVKEVKKYVEFV